MIKYRKEMYTFLNPSFPYIKVVLQGWSLYELSNLTAEYLSHSTTLTHQGNRFGELKLRL